MISKAKEWATCVVSNLYAPVRKFRLAPLYSALHNNLDFNLHIFEAAEWLKRAQDHGTDNGVSWGTRFGSGFRASYPETTGYIICTFLELADLYRDDQFFVRAQKMSEWEAKVQTASGAVMRGTVESYPPMPAIFNTGQVLLGWAAFYRRCPSDEIATAGTRAANWMLSLQGEDGHWIQGNSPLVRQDSTLYNIKAAWGLAEFGRAIGNEDFVEAALRNATYTKLKQRVNGWFEDCCLDDPRRPLLHTIGYTMQGLIGLGKLCGNDSLIQTAAKTADSLISIMSEDGFLPGRINEQMQGTVNWCCLTGSAQTAVVCAQLYELTRQVRYRNALFTIGRYLMRRHDISSPDPTIRGGLAGSWPVWGDYGQYAVLNWATKFFIDALLFYRRFSSESGVDVELLRVS